MNLRFVKTQNSFKDSCVTYLQIYAFSRKSKNVGILTNNKNTSVCRSLFSTVRARREVMDCCGNHKHLKLFALMKKPFNFAMYLYIHTKFSYALFCSIKLWFLSSGVITLNAIKFSKSSGHRRNCLPSRGI